MSPRLVDGRPVPRVRRVFCDWHRGSQKTGGVIELVFAPWMCLRPGQYIHILPNGVQARRVVWQNEVFQGLFPSFGEGETSRNDTEMVVTMRVPRWAVKLPDGAELVVHEGGVSRYYLVGADDRAAVDRIRGMDPMGMAVDEAGWTNLKDILEVMEPRLEINRGWLAILTTPPSVYNEWVHEEYVRMMGDEGSFVSKVTALETFADREGEDGRRIVTDEMIARYRATHGEAACRREFFCEWDAASVSGSIYGDWMKQARDQGRIGEFPHVAGKSVGVFADIGSDNLTTLLFYQQDGSEIRFVDYHAETGASPEKLVAAMMARPYRYGRLVLPHDAGHHRFEAGNISVEDQVRPRLNCEVVVGNKIDSRWTGIYRVREMFSRFRFHEPALGRKPADGVPSFLESMEKYAERTDESGRGTGQIKHEFSDGPDALRTGIQEWREGMSVWDDARTRQERTVRNYNVLEGRPRELVRPRWAA